MKYRFQLYSDLHLEFYKDCSAIKIPNLDSDFIILAGDIHTKTNAVNWLLEQNINKPVIYVCGNHEFYNTSWPKNIDKLKDATKGTNIHILNNDYYIYNDLVLLGATLWTDFNLFGNNYNQQYIMSIAELGLNDYQRIRNSNYNYRKVKAVDILEAHNDSVSFIKEYLEVFKDYNIGIITHHGPSIKCVNYKYREDILSSCYASNLDELVGNSEALFWASAHNHYNPNFMLGNTNCISNMMGYKGEICEGFDINKLFEF